MQRSLLASMILALLTACAGGCADRATSPGSAPGGPASASGPASTARSLPFSAPVPGDLSRRIENAVSRFEKKRPLTEQQEGAVRAAVETIHPHKPEMFSRAGEQKIRAAGAATIPVLAEMLTADDAVTRRKAILALSCLGRPRERMTVDYAPVEEALIVLLRRSLLDTDPEVRHSAVAGLHCIALQRWPRISSEVKDAIRETARNDPDTKVREAARFFAKNLGISVEN